MERAFALSQFSMLVRTGFTVFCLCAAWCRTCDSYAEVFDSLSHMWRSKSRWIWVDIEDQADAVGDVDVENFPCLLIADHQHVYFFGPVLPHAGVANRLFERISSGQAVPIADLGLQALCQRLFQQLA
jgi:thiol-disulfide isomerase/thioredoxin